GPPNARRIPPRLPETHALLLCLARTRLLPTLAVDCVDFAISGAQTNAVAVTHAAASFSFFSPSPRRAAAARSMPACQSAATALKVVRSACDNKSKRRRNGLWPRRKAAPGAPRFPTADRTGNSRHGREAHGCRLIVRSVPRLQFATRRRGSRRASPY